MFVSITVAHTRAIVEAMPHPIPIRSLDDAAHTSPRDLRSFLKHDQNRTLLGFNYGPHDKDLMTYAVYAISLQMDNLVNLDKVIKSGLPASFSDFQNRFVRIRSDMPSIFNPQG